jgi:hypothetical protein
VVDLITLPVDNEGNADAHIEALGKVVPEL